MLLHLKDGRNVEVFRQNCGYYFKNKDISCYPSISWNIDPIEHVNRESKGFFCIADWNVFTRDNCGKLIYHPENIKELIPVKSVISITEIDKWEKE